jgi:outer membrane protein, heavy metal efflux system
MEVRAMRIGKGITGQGRILFVLLAISIASSWASPLRAEEPPRPVNYYVDAALANNPSLASMKARIAGKENEAVRAGALADPKAWIGLVNVPTNTWSLNEEDMTGKEVGISQMLPFPGKRDNSTRIVVQEKEQAGFELAESRNILRADVKAAYAELSTVRAQTEVVRRIRAVLEQIVEVSREMFAVGKGSQADVLRGQVEFQKMREMLLTLENRQRVLSVRLNTLSALPPGEPIPPLEPLAEFPVNFSADELRKIYLEDRPARKAVEARIRKGDLLVQQAELEGKPDFELSASYMQRDNAPDGMKRADMVSAMVSMTLPVWRKGKVDPGIRAMAAEKDMAVRDQETLDNETANGIGSALSSLGNFGSVAALYRTTLIPQAEQSEQSNLEAYRVGKIDFPMLLDSLMAVLNFRREYLGMVGEMHTTKARLEASVGRELDGAAPAPEATAPPNTKNSNGEGR